MRGPAVFPRLAQPPPKRRLARPPRTGRRARPRRRHRRGPHARQVARHGGRPAGLGRARAPPPVRRQPRPPPRPPRAAALLAATHAASSPEFRAWAAQQQLRRRARRARARRRRRRARRRFRRFRRPRRNGGPVLADYCGRGTDAIARARARAPAAAAATSGGGVPPSPSSPRRSAAARRRARAAERGGDGGDARRSTRRAGRARRGARPRAPREPAPGYEPPDGDGRLADHDDDTRANDYTYGCGKRNRRVNVVLAMGAGARTRRARRACEFSVLLAAPRAARRAAHEDPQRVTAVQVGTDGCASSGAGIPGAPNIFLFTARGAPSTRRRSRASSTACACRTASSATRSRATTARTSRTRSTRSTRPTRLAVGAPFGSTAGCRARGCRDAGELFALDFEGQVHARGGLDERELADLFARAGARLDARGLARDVQPATRTATA